MTLLLSDRLIGGNNAAGIQRQVPIGSNASG